MEYRLPPPPKDYFLRNTPLTTPEPDSLLKDTGYLLAQGGAGVVRDVGALTQMVSGDAVGQSLESLGADAADYWKNKLSPTQQREMAKSFLPDADTPFSETALASPRAGFGHLVQNLPMLAIPAGSAGLAGRGAAASARAAGLTGKAVAKRAGAAGAVAGNVAGAGLAAGNVGHETFNAAMMLSPEERATSPYYHARLADGLSPEQAWLKTAIKARDTAGFSAGVVSGILGSYVNHRIGQLIGIGRNAGRIKTGARLGAAESITEFGQEGSEALARQLAIRDIAGGPGLDTRELLESAVAGAAIGGPLGAGIGAVSPERGAEPPPLDIETKLRDQGFDAEPPAGLLPPPEGGTPQADDFVVSPDGTTVRREDVDAYQARQAKRNVEPVLALSDQSKDLVTFPDGTTVRRNEVDAFLSGLEGSGEPADLEKAIRIRRDLYGYSPQPVTTPESEALPVESDSDILSRSGRPFKNKAAAKQAAKRRKRDDVEPVQVGNAAWVLRKPESEVPPPTTSPLNAPEKTPETKATEKTPEITPQPHLMEGLSPEGRGYIAPIVAAEWPVSPQHAQVEALLKKAKKATPKQAEVIRTQAQKIADQFYQDTVDSERIRAEFDQLVPDFSPTHETSIGEPVKVTPNPDVYENAQGELIEDAYASPVEPSGGQSPVGQPDSAKTPTPVELDAGSKTRTAGEKPQAASGVTEVFETKKPHPKDLDYNLPKGAIAGGSEEIGSLVNQTETAKTNDRQSVRYLTVTPMEAKRLSKILKQNVEGYRHSVDSYAVRHILDSHGPDSNENARGQENVSREDFKKIPEIVSHPDTVEHGGYDDRGRDLIRYTKRYNGTTFYVEEVRGKRRELMAKTLWKTRHGPSATSEEGVSQTSKTLSRNPPEPDNTVQPPPKKGKEPAQSESSTSLLRGLSDALFKGESFSTIRAARKWIADQTGQKVVPGTSEAKKADELIETAAVDAARRIVQAGADPSAIYARLLKLQDQLPHLSTRTSTSIAQQAYSTPLPLAYVASRLAGVSTGTRVLEPAAGNGALLLEATPDKAQVNELNRDRAAVLRDQGFTVSAKDASTQDFKEADRIIANPPFGVVKEDTGESRVFKITPEYSTTEIDHAISLNALDALSEDGRAVLIIGAPNKLLKGKARSNAYNGKAKRAFSYTLYNQYNVVDHFTVSGALYAKQGAAWPVDVIVIEGRRKSARALPAADVPRIIDSWETLGHELKTRRPVRRTEPDHRPDRSPVEGRTRPARHDAVPSQPAVRSRASGRTADGQSDGVRSEPKRSTENARPRSVPLSPKSTEPVRERGGNRAVHAPNPRKVKNTFQTAYAPSSKLKDVDTLVPVNMQSAVNRALKNVVKKRGAVDTYVAHELEYSPSELAQYFSAEQVDALALALDNLSEGKGFIIGDQTGVGKGRVNAGVIRWAIRQGKTPIFVTQDPQLYGDMLRDLTDIGMPDTLPTVTNTSFNIPLDPEAMEWYDKNEIAKGKKEKSPKRTGKFLKTPGGAKHNKMMADATKSGELENPVIFTTYSQMQTIKGAHTLRHNFLEHFADDSVVLLDESHNAGGTDIKGRPDQKVESNAGKGGRAGFVRNLAQRASGVFYSSATFAKRPDVMDLYFRTDMGITGDMGALKDALKAGKVPLQQVTASMLAESGQYIRREKSFDGIAYQTTAAPVNQEFAENSSEIMRDIMEFDRLKARAVDALDKDLKSEGRTVSGDRSTGGAGAMSANFTSVMHNLIGQMLLALKVDAAVAEAKAALARHEKPVIALSNTMGAAIDGYVDEVELSPGDPIGLSFGDLLDRYLDKSRRVMEGNPFGKKTTRTLTEKELGPVAWDHYRAVKEKIRTLGFDEVPMSPVDAIHRALRKEGYRTGEITGRTAIIDYSGETPVYRKRPSEELKTAGKRKVIDDFNSGEVDVIILNQSGATGISLHSNTLFKDTRVRHMILAQAELNIDTHMQMLGRVNRTGQVNLPIYSQLVADIPAELRPAAILAHKMASLNAATTAARGSALKAEDTPDFMNEYGDAVAAQIMADNPEWHDALGRPLPNTTSATGAGLDPTDAMRKVTGRIPVLSLAQQNQVYSALKDAYKELIAFLDATGDNALEAKTLDYDAKPVSEMMLVPSQSRSASPFAGGVKAEILDIKHQGKPYPFDKALKMAADAKAVDTTAMEQKINAFAESLKNRWADDTKRLDSELMKLEAQSKRVNRFVKFKPGTSVRIGDTYAVVGKLERKGSSKNPAVPSAWKMTFYVADAYRQMTLPLSKLSDANATPGVGQVRLSLADRDRVKAAFDKGQSETRTQRTVLTGNLLAGFTAAGSGRIINFTRHGGEISAGILMPEGFDAQKSKEGQPVGFKTPEHVAQFVARVKKQTWKITATKGEVSLSGKGDGSVQLAVPSRKSDGGRYYLNQALMDAAGGEFVKSGASMRISFEKDRLAKVVQVLSQMGETFATQSHKEDANAVMGIRESRGSSEARGAFNPRTGTIHLKDTEDRSGVFLHEIFHRGLQKDPQLVKARERLLKHLDRLHRQAQNGTVPALSRFYRRAQERVTDAGVKPELAAEEFAAYAIEEYENAPRSLPQQLLKWVTDLIAQVKAYLIRAGVDIKNVAPADLSALARQSVTRQGTLDIQSFNQPQEIKPNEIQDKEGNTHPVVRTLRRPGGVQRLLSITREEAEHFGSAAVRFATKGPETTGLQGWFLPLTDFLSEKSVDYATGKRSPRFSVDELLRLEDLQFERDTVRVGRDVLPGSGKGRSVLHIEVESKGWGQPADLYSKLTPDLEKEFQETRARYLGTPQWMKAPNGKPTKLNERNWVMVRTPRFKKWFGDWERAQHQQIIDALDPVTLNWDAKTEVPAIARRRALEEVKKRYLTPEKTTHRVVVKESGDEILISKSGLKKASSGHSGVQKMRILPVLPELIENAHFVTGAPDESRKTSIKSYRYYVARPMIDGKEYYVKLVVREIQEGKGAKKKFYDHELSEVHEVAGLTNPAHPKATDGSPATTSLDFIRHQGWRKFKGMASKVVDENGEPLRVFKGMPANDTGGKPINSIDRKTSFPAFHGDEPGVSIAGFFTSSPTVASRFAQVLTQGGNTVFPVFLNIQNPRVFEGRGKPARESQFGLSGKPFRDAIRQGQQDGVFLKNTKDEGDVFVTQDSNQSKSALGNTGAFSDVENDIRYSRMSEEVGRRVYEGSESAKALKDRGFIPLLGEVLSTLRPRVLGAFGRKQIVDMYQKILPQLKTYDHIMESMGQLRNERQTRSWNLVKEWKALQNEDADRLADVMSRATLNESDPDPEVGINRFKGEKSPEYKERLAAHRDLKAEWEKLSQGAQEIYRKVRQDYVSYREEVTRNVLERLDHSKIQGKQKQALKEAITLHFMKDVRGPYFPLARFGEWILVGKDAEGNKVVSMRDSDSAIENLRAEWLKEGITVEKKLTKKEYNPMTDATSPQFMKDLFEILMSEGVAESTMDAVNQMYLNSLPEASVRKHDLHRKKVKGFSKNAQRAYAQYMFHGAFHLAKLKYSQRLQNKLDRMQAMVTGKDEEKDPIRQHVVNEMVKRHAEEMNPHGDSLSHVINGFGFSWLLGLNLSSALVNLSQTPLMALPQLAADHDWGAASKALWNASGPKLWDMVSKARDLHQEPWETIKNEYLETKAEREAFQVLLDAQVIELGRAMSLAGLSEGAQVTTSDTYQGMMKVMGTMFHVGEVVNRVVTFKAAFQLAKDQGLSQRRATQYARDIINNSHFDYTADNRPRWMRGPVTRVAFQFKQFSQNSYYQIFRNFRQMLKNSDASPEERARAKKVFTGIMITHGMAAGALGLPVVWTIAAMLEAMLDDEDDPVNIELAFRNGLADLVGPELGQAMAKGPLSVALGADMTSRIGLNGMWFHDDSRDLEGRALYQSVVNQLLGPVVGSVLPNIAYGTQLIGQGQVIQGLEKMTPSFMKNVIQAYRYHEDGVVDSYGNIIMDDVAFPGVVKKAGGLSPLEISEVYDKRGRLKNLESRLTRRKTVLLRNLRLARQHGDAGDIADAMIAIQRFSRKNPDRAITSKTIRQSIRAQRRRAQQSQYGVYAPKSRQHLFNEIRY